VDLAVKFIKQRKFKRARTKRKQEPRQTKNQGEPKTKQDKGERQAARLCLGYMTNNYKHGQHQRIGASQSFFIGSEKGEMKGFFRQILRMEKG
jgi:hypothetical protein